MVGLKLDSRPWLGFDSNGSSFLLSPLNAQAEVVVLAGFLEGVEGAGTVYVFAHETHALAHGNFVVGKFAGGKRVLIDPGIADEITFEVITFEIALSTGALAREANRDRR